MRRAYRETLRRVFSPQGSGSWHRIALKALSAHIRPGLLQSPIISPILATLEVTRACNLDCLYCESHRKHRSSISIDWAFPFIREMAEAGVMGLGFTGGEPLLAESFENLATEAARAGMVTHLNTNGTLITDHRASSVLEAGFRSINVSLDGAEASTHDLLRGQGSFLRTMSGIESLIRTRERLKMDTRILLAMTLGEFNARQAPDMLHLARNLGLEGCTFLPYTTFSTPSQPTPAPESIEACKALQDLAPMLDNSLKYLKGMERFFQGASMTGRCSALHTSLLVSFDQKIYPCVPSALRGTGGRPFQPQEAMSLFRSGALASCVDDTLCRRCWWNCHRELDLALGVIG